MNRNEKGSTVAQLNACDRDGFAAALGHVFERSPWVAEETFDRRPFRDLAQLHAELCATMNRASRARRLELIRAHPDLAGRLAFPGQLTSESGREQSAAGLDRMTPDELADFQRLNAAYRKRFDFPFVICARLNHRNSIRRALETRLRNSIAMERAAALSEIEKIAWLRLRDCVKE
jgi:2-oxo-4-hydroxy-4-carboxy-5-ureidoimidazoline decarboxylase